MIDLFLIQILAGLNFIDFLFFISLGDGFSGAIDNFL